ncbi:hypothetical protein ACFL6B_04245 [Thermodesulfobacteriota bacterium]
MFNQHPKTLEQIGIERYHLWMETTSYLAALTVGIKNPPSRQTQIAIYIAQKYFSSLNTPARDMVQHSKGI